MPIKEWPKEPKQRRKKEKSKKQPKPKESSTKDSKKVKVKKQKKSSPFGTHGVSKLKAPKKTKEGFSTAWCYCEKSTGIVERTKRECKCGWSKTHKHCGGCGGTVNVG